MNYLLTDEQSKRLKYRPLVPNDFEEWMSFFTDPSIARFLGMDPTKSQHELNKQWFEFSQNRYNKDLGGMNVLEHKESGKIVGQCGILVQDLDGEPAIEIGYSLLPEYWGQGYASEAAQKCRDYAFENNITNTLISIIHIDNVPSVKVAIRNGMKESKTTEFKGMPVNVYKITIDEWKLLKSIRIKA